MNIVGGGFAKPGNRDGSVPLEVAGANKQIPPVSLRSGVGITNEWGWSMRLPSVARLDSRGRLSLHVPW
jgi:hypothetical protein